MPRSRNNRTRRGARNRSRQASPLRNALRYGSLVSGIVVTLSAGAYGVTNFMPSEQMGEDFCFARTDQPVTAIFIESSLTHQLGDTQRRDYQTAFGQVWDTAPGNTRIDVFTTTKGEAGSLAAPVFTLCKPVATTAELEAINAPSQTVQQVTYNSERARAAFHAGISEVLANASDPNQAAEFSPIIETVGSISRYPGFSGEERTLVVLSDGIQNSTLAQFCRVRGHMPSYGRFAERAEFESVRPRSLRDVKVRMFLVEHGPLPSEQLPYCSNQELAGWYADYFSGNGADPDDVEITAIRAWGD